MYYSGRPRILQLLSNRAGKLQLQRRGSLGRTDKQGLNEDICHHTVQWTGGRPRGAGRRPAVDPTFVMESSATTCRRFVGEAAHRLPFLPPWPINEKKSGLTLSLIHTGGGEKKPTRDTETLPKQQPNIWTPPPPSFTSCTCLGGGQVLTVELLLHVLPAPL